MGNQKQDKDTGTASRMRSRTQQDNDGDSVNRMNNTGRMGAMGPRKGQGHQDMGKRKIVETLGAEWLMRTMGTRWEWREQEQGGTGTLRSRTGTGAGWRQGHESRVGIRSRTRTQGAVDSGNRAVDRDTRVVALGTREA